MAAVSTACSPTSGATTMPPDHRPQSSGKVNNSIGNNTSDVCVRNDLEAFAEDGSQHVLTVDSSSSSSNNKGIGRETTTVSNDYCQAANGQRPIGGLFGANMTGGDVDACIYEDDGRGPSVTGVVGAPGLYNSPLSPDIRLSYTPFCGYIDGGGILHAQADWQEEKTELEPENCNDATIFSSYQSSSQRDETSEEKGPGTVEEVLRASQNFARSHAEKGFCSNLEHLYSASKRNLYPSLDDMEIEDPRSESASAVTPPAFTPPESIVPEPPGKNNDDDEDVKVGVVSANCESPAYAFASAESEAPAYAVGSAANDSPAYAVASVREVFPSSTEATVLETAQTPEDVLWDKLAQEDAEMVALKRAAYYGVPSLHPNNTAMSSGSLSAPDERATVVEITEHYVHPSDISTDTVTAELIGADYNNLSSANTTVMDTVSEEPAPASARTASTAGSFLQDDSVVNSEATIIHEKASLANVCIEEAVVLNDDSSTACFERKPAATSVVDDSHTGYQCNPPNDAENSDEEVANVVVAGREGTVEGEERQRVAFADEVGEVVGISEQFHPAEVPDNEVEAELIGEDFNCTVAVPQQSSNGPIESSTTNSVEGSSEIQAALVVGYEDEDEANISPSPTATARAYSYGSPRPDPVTLQSRVYSAPSSYVQEHDSGSRRENRLSSQGEALVRAEQASSSSVQEHHSRSLRENRLSSPAETFAGAERESGDDWMRTPSFGGASSEQDIVAMQPPGDNAGTPVVAVAALPVNALSSGGGDSPANLCSVGDSHVYSPQSEVPIASLNAYASAAPGTHSGETDCHAMASLRQRGSLGAASETSSITEHADIPPPRSFNPIGGASEAGNVSSSTGTSNKGGFQKISTSIARGMEMLFGDSKPSRGRKSCDNATAAQFVVPRTLLPWSVIHSEATNMWVATVNTNQKALESKNVVEASKSLRAFSVVTEKQATCLAKAWSPPTMHPFSKHPACHICSSKFAVFHRPCHCRNCGICVCTNCVLPWPSKMVPETYNIKKESFVNTCKGCDWLCTSFRLALLEGDMDKAIALHSTGNVNLVTPFANVKGELFYPVHCAALGGNLNILKWLVDDNCCPIKSVRVSGRCRDASNSFTEISTSKGRSLLGIALENHNVGIVRYLVVDKGIQLTGEKDITMDTLCQNLDLVLRLLPEEASRHTGNAYSGALHLAALAEEVAIYESAGNETHEHEMRALNDNASDVSVTDACIICFDATINCVATPCGHQVCCMECSKNIERCPVCAVECGFMRVFRP